MKKFTDKWNKKTAIDTETGKHALPKVDSKTWNAAQKILEKQLKEYEIDYHVDLLGNLKVKDFDDDIFIKIDRKDSGLDRSFYFVYARKQDGTYENIFLALANSKIDGILGFGGYGVAKVAVTKDNKGLCYKASRPSAEDEEHDVDYLKERTALCDGIYCNTRPAKNSLWIGDKLDKEDGTLTLKAIEIYPIYEGATLKEVVDNRLEKLTEYQRIKIAYELLLAIKKFHGNGWVHRDLQGANIIINIKDDDINVNIIDPGVACQLKPQKLATGEIVSASIQQTSSGSRFVVTEQDDLLSCMNHLSILLPSIEQPDNEYADLFSKINQQIKNHGILRWSPKYETDANGKIIKNRDYNETILPSFEDALHAIKTQLHKTKESPNLF